MSKYSVTASMLNLRSTPTKQDSSNIIGKIQFQHSVELIEKTTPDWWKVVVIGTPLKGYVSAKYLAILADDSTVYTEIKEANFSPDPKASLDSKMYMHKPIGDSSIPYRDLSTPDSKKNSIHQLINKLNVASSIRYKRTDTNTFCNIYAYDYCYFCRAYIPRVWWNMSAIKKLLKEEPVEIIYGNTVNELNANALHDWFLDWGDDFGWERFYSVNDLQERINQTGGVGIICVKRKDTNRSGHIVAVVPENDSHKAYRQNGIVIYPLQSQAGAQNFNYFSEGKKDWWHSDNFSSFVFFYHP